MTAAREVIAGREIPSAIGPYSPAVRAGEFLFVSGQPGVDPESAQPASPTFGEQARQAFRNLDAVLRAGSSRPDLVVNTTVLVADASAFAEPNELYADFLPSQPDDASATTARPADLDRVHRTRRELTAAAKSPEVTRCAVRRRRRPAHPGIAKEPADDDLPAEKDDDRRSRPTTSDRRL